MPTPVHPGILPRSLHAWAEKGFVPGLACGTVLPFLPNADSAAVRFDSVDARSLLRILYAALAELEDQNGDYVRDFLLPKRVGTVDGRGRVTVYLVSNMARLRANILVIPRAGIAADVDCRVFGLDFLISQIRRAFRDLGWRLPV